MDVLRDLASSPYIWAIACGWFFAHVAKYLVLLASGKRPDVLRLLFASGGMPSSHSSLVSALWMVVLLKDGAASSTLGVASALAVIVCYDAVNVRYIAGELGVTLASLIKQQNLGLKPPRVVRGHTLVEMIVGVLLGLSLGFIVFLATK